MLRNIILFLFILPIVSSLNDDDVNQSTPLINENFINIYKYHYQLAMEGNVLDERMISHFNKCKYVNIDENVQYYGDASYLSPNQIDIYSEIGSLSNYIPQKLTESFFDIPLDNLNEFLQTTEYSKYPTFKDFIEGFKKNTHYDEEFHKVIINHIELGNTNLLKWTKTVVERIKEIPNYYDKWKFILITPTVQDIIPKYNKIYKFNNNTTKTKILHNNLVPTLYETLSYIKRTLPIKTFIVILKNEDMGIWRMYKDFYKYCQFATKDWFLNEDMTKNCSNCDNNYNKWTWQVFQRNITKYFNTKYFNVNIINLLDNFVPLIIKTNQTKGEWADLSFISIDCKHLSDIGISIFHTAIWNWLISPRQTKYESRSFFKPTVQVLRCPLPSCPFMVTDNNFNFCKYNGLPNSSKFKSILFHDYFGEEAMILILIISAIILYTLIWRFISNLMKKEKEYRNNLKNKWNQLSLTERGTLLNL
uniref:PRESAN domain-containing protein n=2 Tax=Strongyloides stercoralis TaxID=6248 RepID=A0A0K0DVY2_STRER